MAKTIEKDLELQSKIDKFVKKIDSNMIFESDFNSDAMSFDWINEIDFACQYLDNIVRNPKRALLKEADTVKIEKAMKITVASVKDLTRHVQYIEKVDKVTQDVKPGKILIERNEETFTTYENRFVYTLLKNLDRFVAKKDDMLKKLEIKNDKVLEYKASTLIGNEKIDIELKMTSASVSDEGTKALAKEIELMKAKMKRIKEYMNMWRRSEFVTELDRARTLLVQPPIRKNNVILKNPNFQVAMKLWDFLQNYEESENDQAKKENSKYGKTIQSILDDAFLMDFYAFDAINASKREQKRRITQYALIMANQQIKRVIELLLDSGINLSEDELLSIVLNNIKIEKTEREFSANDVKKKFKSIMDEYLEKTQDYL